MLPEGVGGWSLVEFDLGQGDLHGFKQGLKCVGKRLHEVFCGWLAVHPDELTIVAVDDLGQGSALFEDEGVVVGVDDVFVDQSFDVAEVDDHALAVQLGCGYHHMHLIGVTMKVAACSGVIGQGMGHFKMEDFAGADHRVLA